MSATTGYYSIIQYCPDPSRQEAANVGVILFCPELEYLGVRTAKSNRRIHRFFGSREMDSAQLNAIKMSIQRRLEIDRDQFTELADLERFAATRANAMRLTPPRMVQVESPDSDLNRLFERLVRERSQGKTAQLRKALTRAFNAEAIAPLIRHDAEVTLPDVLCILRFPFAFDNSRFNLIRPACFRGLSPGAVLRRAGRLAMEGELLFNARDSPFGRLKLLVLGDFAPAQQDLALAVERVLERNYSELHRLDEIEKLLEVIRTTANPLVAQGQASSLANADLPGEKMRSEE